MRGNYIEFISAYCDRCCERCAFTDRCSSHAVKLAARMCDGDTAAAVELAVGAPPPRDEKERARRERVLETGKRWSSGSTKPEKLARSQRVSRL